jgi:alpha-tubulin suppressor-like RCC1 family protein/uncharacterized protein YjdB
MPSSPISPARAGFTLVVLTLLSGACSNDSKDPSTLFQGSPASATAAKVTIMRPLPELIEGDSLQLAATVDGGGSNAQVLWTPLDAMTATISSGGMVHTLLAGSARFEASFGGRADTAAVLIRQRIGRVGITQTLGTLEAIGAETQLTARVFDVHGIEMPNATVVWRSLNGDVVEPIADGRFRARANGVATIEVTASAAPSVVAQTALAVSQRVSSVQLAPDTVSLHTLGATASLMSVARDANGNPIAGVTVTYTSSDNDVARVDNTGKVNAVGNGVATITASAPAGGLAPANATVVASARVQVAQTAARLEFAPSDATIDAIGGTLTLAATARDADNNIIAGQKIVFSSTNAGVLTVDANTGLATAVSSGAVRVRATSGSLTAMALITVDPRVVGVSMAPTSVTLHGAGETARFRAIPRDANRNEVQGKEATYTVADTRIARIDAATGVATAIAEGSTQVTATVDGVRGNGSLIVGATSPPVVSGQAVLQMALGSVHTCALVADGSVYCWGVNREGELGSGSYDPNNHPVPQRVTGGLHFVTISAGQYHVCGLTSAGEQYCWGLRFGSTKSNVPVPVGGPALRSLVSGSAYSCGLTASDETYCWGAMAPNFTGDPTPQRVPTPLPFVRLSGGDHHVCGITGSGAAYCWGRNAEGQLGIGSVNPDFRSGSEPLPVAVVGGITFASLSAGVSNTCGVSTSGVSYCWGANGAGGLANGTVGGAHNPTPGPVTGGITFSIIDVPCALSLDGTAYCWGQNAFGERGDTNVGLTSTNYHATPQPINSSLHFKAIYAWSFHTCGISVDGNAYCWGSNVFGQLGDGTLTHRNVPTRVVIP